MRKGFNLPMKTVIILAIGLIAAMLVISLMSDGTSMFLGFSNTSTPSGGFIE